MPFERWIAAFFKTVYSPNIRVWHREPKEIGFLEPQFASYLHRQVQATEPRGVSDPSKLKLYLQTHKRGKVESLVDINEERRLAQLNLSSLEPEAKVFTSPSLAPKPPEVGEASLQRMSEVVESAKERSAEESVR